MKTKLMLSMLATSMLMCGVASADPFKVGFGMDLGVPSGASVGVVVHPGLDMISLQPSLTYNLLNFGGRLSVKVDPMALLPRLPFGVFLDGQLGFAADGKVPGRANLPEIGYQYANAYLGLRFGKMNNFHWLLEGGMSYLAVHTDNFQSVVSNNSSLVIGNPSTSGVVFPTAITGFEVSW